MSMTLAAMVSSRRRALTTRPLHWRGGGVGVHGGVDGEQDSRLAGRVQRGRNGAGRG